MKMESGANGDINKKVDSETGNSGRIPPFPVFLVGMVIFSQLLSVGTFLYASGQYGYSRFGQDLYPNLTIRSGESRCVHNINSTQFKMEADIQELTSKWTIYNALALSPILISAPVLSSLSDRYGRKYVMLIPMIGTLLRGAVLCFHVHFNWNIYLVPVINAIQSLCGDWLVSVAVGCSYASDMTSSGKDRSIAIAVVELFIGIGLLLGTFTSGYIIKSLGYIAVFVLNVAVAILCIIVLLVFVPESLPSDKRSYDLNILRQVKLSIDFFIKKEVKGASGERWRYVVCIAIFSCVSFGTIGKGSVELLYQLGSPFCLTSVDISNWGTYRTVLQQVFGVTMIKVLQRFVTDEFIAIIGLVSAVGYFIMEGLATNVVGLYFVPVIGCMGIVELIMLRSIMSKMTPMDKQGSLFAGVALFETLFVMLGATASASIYTTTVSLYRGMVFFILAAINGIGLIMMVILYLKGRSALRYSVDITVPTSDTSL